MGLFKKRKQIKTTALWRGFTYQLIKSGRRSLSLEIDDKATLTVRSPFRMGDRDIENYLNQYHTWIQKKVLQSKEKQGQVSHTTFVNGEEIIFLGVGYSLRINNDKKNFSFNDGVFNLHSSRVEDGASYLESWYRKRAKEICLQISSDVAKEMDVTFTNIRINGPKHRWGSCSTKGNLNFSWKLMMAPENVLRYVIVHELSHLTHMNHSRKFWDNVERHMPNYKQYKRWLKDNGHTLVI